MYLAAAVAFSIFLFGLALRFRLWRLGRGHLLDESGRGGYRLWRLVKSLLGQKAVLRERLPGWAHLSLIIGAFVFVLGTLTIAIEEHLGVPLFRGGVYLAESLLMDVMALMSLAGVLFFLWRRLFIKPDGLERGRGDLLVLLLWGFILISGLILEGIRMSLDPDPAPLFSPAGNLLSLAARGIEEGKLSGFHPYLWWLHMGAAFSFVAVFPWTRMMHAIAAPLNQYLAGIDDNGILRKIDFDAEEPFGAVSVGELHRKQLLELDACMWCGRCQRACPAHLSGKPLSPEKIGTDLLAACLETRKHPTGKVNLLSGTTEEAPNFVEDEGLWSCTTCRACEVQCPVNVEHVRRIIDLRRALVMRLARLPESVRVVFRNLQTSGNPWNFPASRRLEWGKGMDVPLAQDGGEPSTVFWAGCLMALDQESRSSIRIIARNLRDLGIDYKVLGSEEYCCGDPARRLGNEFLFQEMVRKNIEIFRRKKVEKIITPCPHCFHMFSREYPEFGFKAEVIHHGELIVSAWRSYPDRSDLTEGQEKGNVTFHDPCYLARYGYGTDGIRQLLADGMGNSFRELPLHGENGFCCGSGGGRFWMEDEPGTRISTRRCEEIIEANVQAVITACPYCRITIKNGLEEKGAHYIRVIDLAEHLDGHIQITNGE